MIDTGYLSDQPTTRARAVMLVGGAVALGQAVAMNNGNIHPAALGWLGLGIVCLIGSLVPSLARGSTLVARLRVSTIIIAALAVQLGQLVYWDQRWGTRDPATMLCLLACGAGAA